MKQLHHTIRAICMAMALCCAALAWAQPQPWKFNPEEFRMHLESEISRQAGFTGKEAKKFFPIYHEMKERQRQVQDKIFQLKRNTPANDASDKTFLTALMEIKKLEVEKAEIEEQYYKKMCKAVPPRKVFFAMQAEDQFHRNMLRDFRKPEKWKNGWKQHP